MAITISATLIRKLPPAEQGDKKNVEEFFWQKSGGKCFLCEENFNRATDDIVLDHDLPEKEGGETERANLNLVHHVCNSAKRNTPSIPIKPFLRFSAFVKRNGSKVTYGQATSHFGIEPKPCALSITDNVATIELPDGRTLETPILSETNARGVFRYVYVEVPKEALFNDPKCQPRTIKPPHLWSIYTDLQRNPLHEAPGCRIEPTGQHGMYYLLMFDGQHKTIANWLMDRKTIVAKVYLDLPAHAAIELVNSIQSKIKKLPLSPFELANKLADEWQHKLAVYEEEVGPENASEKGFIDWLPQPERNRGKHAFKAALIKNLFTDQDLDFRNYVIGSSTKTSEFLITEATFKSKVLEKLLVLDALTENADEAQVLRSRERNNIVQLLNIFTEMVFKPDDGATELTAQQKERLKRMLYQSSLAEISKHLRGIFRHILAIEPPGEMMEKEPSADQWNAINVSVKRLADHLVWSADFTTSRKMAAVGDAMQKNQELDKALSAVGMKLGYIVGADTIDASCIQDAD